MRLKHFQGIVLSPQKSMIEYVMVWGVGFFFSISVKDLFDWKLPNNFLSYIS